MLLTYAVCLTDTPLGKGFGITAILAGVDHCTLPLLDGAGFSGRLREPVQLRIDVHETRGTRADVTYRLERMNEMRNDRIWCGMFRRRQMEPH